MTSRKTGETALAFWLHQGGKEFLGDYQDQRIENLIRKSTPDYEGFLRGIGQFWCELKTAARPKKASTPIRFKFQEGQARWAAKRWYIGGSAWILSQVGSGATAKRYLVRGFYAPSVEEGLTEDQLLDVCSIDPRSDAVEMIRCMATRGTQRPSI